MSMSQNGDVKLTHTSEGGDVEITSGLIEMSGGLETAVYISMFGGNEDDTTWWGNLDETEASRKLESETQKLLKALPLTTGNMLRVEEAVLRDIKWLTEGGIASSITVEVRLPDLNVLQIDISISAYGEETDFQFVENWKSTTVPVPEGIGSVSIDSATEIWLEDGTPLWLEDSTPLLLG